MKILRLLTKRHDGFWRYDIDSNILLMVHDNCNNHHHQCYELTIENLISIVSVGTFIYEFDNNSTDMEELVEKFTSLFLKRYICNDMFILEKQR
ncbi:MAG: hypothetical protein ACOCZ5_01735 [bacterium]